ncbi:hypothetical protein CRUP_037408, partial [Coryphaenoides rupestris]
DGIADHVLQEHLEDTAGLLVDQTGDTLHSAATSQAADGGLGDALDVVTENLTAMRFGSQGESRYWGQIQFILSHPRWRSEAEALKEGGEEEEELHPGQTFTWTRPAT